MCRCTSTPPPAGSWRRSSRPELEWDFRLPRVQSINASGHKYGLVYPGVGWAIWRDKEALPRDLVFDVNYLGGHMPTFSLNFSRPGSEVIAQYFMFTSLGRSGYTAMMANLQETAMHISDGIVEARALPADLRRLASCRCSPSRSAARRPTTPCSTSPSGCASAAGSCPPTPSRENRQDLSVLRIVVRSGMHMEMADDLLHHLRDVTETLEALDGPLPRPVASTTQAFAH